MTEWGIDTLFNPGKRHMDEEKRRLQSTREEIGDSSGGKRIDLESGVVKISRPKHDPDGAPADSDEPAETETAEDETAEDETAEDETAEDETAQPELAASETAEDETAEDETGA